MNVQATPASFAHSAAMFPFLTMRESLASCQVKDREIEAIPGLPVRFRLDPAWPAGAGIGRGQGALVDFYRVVGCARSYSAAAGQDTAVREPSAKKGFSAPVRAAPAK